MLLFLQVVILEHKSIICPGYSCILHIHNVVEEVTLLVRVLLKYAHQIANLVKMFYSFLWCGVVWCGMVWYGMVWYCDVWCDVLSVVWCVIL